MLKVKAIIDFTDLVENTKRKIGDIFEVSKERAEFLLSHNAIEFVEIENNADKVVIEPVSESKEFKEIKEKFTPKKSNKKKGKK